MALVVSELTPASLKAKEVATEDYVDSNVATVANDVSNLTTNLSNLSSTLTTLESDLNDKFPLVIESTSAPGSTMHPEGTIWRHSISVSLASGTETRYDHYISNGDGTWEDLGGTYVDGSSIITGTIDGKLIKANTVVLTPTLTNSSTSPTATASFSATDPLLEMVDSSGNTVKLTPGELEFYRDGVAYKSAKRIEAGYCSGGTSVTFSPAFINTPLVYVTMDSMPVYDSDNSGLDQELVIRADNVTVSGFDPVAYLSLDGQQGISGTPTGVLWVNGGYDYYDSYVDRPENDVVQVTLGVILGDTHEPEPGSIEYDPAKISLWYETYYGSGSWVQYVNAERYYLYDGTVYFTTPLLDSPNGARQRIRIGNVSNFNSPINVVSVTLQTVGFDDSLSGDLRYLAIER